jgi:hypothetical protein
VQAEDAVKVGQGELLPRGEVRDARGARVGVHHPLVLAVRGGEFGAVDEEELAGRQVPDGVALARVCEGRVWGCGSEEGVEESVARRGAWE